MASDWTGKSLLVSATIQNHDRIPSLSLPPFLTSSKGFAIFRRPPARSLACLASDPAMPHAPTSRTAPHYFCVRCSPDVSAKVSAFGACLCLFRTMHFNFVRDRIELKHEQRLANSTRYICRTVTVTTTSEAQTQTTARLARPDVLLFHEHGDACPQTLTPVSVQNARVALKAVSVLVLRYVSPLLHRQAAVARATSDSHNSRISSQALTAIILCASIVCCVLVGCVLQLPAAYISLRNRYFRSRRTGTPTSGSSSSSMPGLSDVEMGDQDTAGSLDCSPPPPYSRAPSYESSGDRDNNTSIGGRGECQSTS